jgi:hypothetical protein
MNLGPVQRVLNVLQEYNQDIIEVVRCGDCVHGLEKYINRKFVGIDCRACPMEYRAYYTKKTDYCSVGKRK